MLILKFDGNYETSKKLKLLIFLLPTAKLVITFSLSFSLYLSGVVIRFYFNEELDIFPIILMPHLELNEIR